MLEYVGPQGKNQIFTVNGENIFFKNVSAAVYAQGFNLAAFLWGEDMQGQLYLLDRWQSESSKLDFDVAEQLGRWRDTQGLKNIWIAYLEELPAPEQTTNHPIASEIMSTLKHGLWADEAESRLRALTDGACPSMSLRFFRHEPYAGLLAWGRVEKAGRLVTEHFGEYARLLEEIRRIEDPAKPELKPWVNAFLGAMQIEAAPRAMISLGAHAIY